MIFYHLSFIFYHPSYLFPWPILSLYPTQSNRLATWTCTAKRREECVRYCLRLCATVFQVSSSCSIAQLFLLPPIVGGYSHFKAYRDVLPKWVTISPKFLRNGPISQKVKKKSVKSAGFFWGRKPLGMCSDMKKIKNKQTKTKTKNSQICFVLFCFLREKNP